MILSSRIARHRDNSELEYGTSAYQADYSEPLRRFPRNLYLDRDSKPHCQNPQQRIHVSFIPKEPSERVSLGSPYMIPARKSRKLRALCYYATLLMLNDNFSGGRSEIGVSRTPALTRSQAPL